MILGYKGFKPGLIATLGSGKYHYQPGEMSQTEKAKCANTGFHYCLDPLDCLDWYPWNGENEFWAVAVGGDIDEDGYKTRSSCTQMVPLRQLDAEQMILLHANYVFEHPAEEFKDVYKKPFHVAYEESSTLSGKQGDWLCFISRTSKEYCCIAKQVDGVKILADKEYTAKSLEAAYHEEI